MGLSKSVRFSEVSGLIRFIAFFINLLKGLVCSCMWFIRRQVNEEKAEDIMFQYVFYFSAIQHLKNTN